MTIRLLFVEHRLAADFAMLLTLYTSCRAAERTIATIPARTASGSFGQASITARRSSSLGRLSPDLLGL